jgi:superfamily II DNA or RNA helicase
MTNIMDKILDRINIFKDIYTLTKGLTNNEKGTIFEIITKYIFLLHPFYANTTKNVWLFDELTDRMKTKFNIPSKDEGIDLVLETTNGKFYAIQCKYRSNNSDTVDWKELSTFVGLTFGVANGFEKGYYVTNIYDINKNIKNSNKITTIYGDFFEELDSNFFDRMKETYLKSNIKTKQIIKQQLPHQVMISTSVLQHFTQYIKHEFNINKKINLTNPNNRCYIEVACGAGKTLTSYWIDKYLDNQLTIIAVPSLYLLSQFYKEWAIQSHQENINIEYLLVGSDADIKNEGEAINGYSLTTNVDELTKHIQNRKRKFVIVTTYQSSDCLINVLNKLLLVPDFCIFDEAHKTVGQIGKQFSLLLDDNNLKIKNRLFMTATSKIYGGKTDDIDSDILSMDDKKWYGKCVYSYNTANAIRDGKLVDYQIVTMFTNDEFINNFINENKYVNTENLEDQESHYIGSAVMIIKALTTGECTHLITYHSSIGKSKKFERILNEIIKLMKFDVSVYHMDGNTSMSNRNKLITNFTKNKLAILSSARVLNEGINIPIVDSVCFVDPRQSTIDIIQCVGRSLRLYDSKITAKILVPLICEDINNLTETAAYGNLVKIIKSLAETDPTIYEYFGKKSNGNKVNRNIFKHINYTSSIKLNEKINLQNWIKELELKIWKNVNTFEYMYNKLIDWVCTNKKIPSSIKTDVHQKTLATWCERNRLYKRQNILDDKRIKLLEAIDGWYWGKTIIYSFKTFDERYNELKPYVAIHKQLPSKNSKDETTKKLGVWCSMQRSLKKKNKLSSDKIKSLEAINCWYWGSDEVIAIKSFDERYNELKNWVIENNELPTESQNKSLNLWCQGKRTEKRADQLSEKQINLLSQISGWFWDVKPRSEYFMEKFNEVKNWTEENNRIPNNSENSIERSFSKWCFRQREHKKNGKLSEDCIKLLESLNGWYWVQKDLFQIKYNELIELVNKNKKIPTSHSKDENEKELGIWITNKRILKKQNKLTEDQITLLEKIPGWFWTKESKKLQNNATT